MTVAGRTRLAIAGVATASLALAAVVLYAAWLQYTVRVRADELERQVVAIARGLEATGRVDLAADVPLQGVRAQLFAVEGRLIGAQLALTDASGTVRQSSAATAIADSYDIQRLTGAPDAQGVRRGVKPLTGAGRVIIVAVPVASDGSTGYLVAVQAVRELAAARSGVGLLLLAVTLVAIAGSWVVGGVVARRLTAPIVRLDEGARAIAAGSWGHRVPVEGDAEIASLARSFNEMSGRVDAAYAAQRAFVGDVSHELRTPITSIQGFARALQDDIARDAGERDRFVRIIQQEAWRLMELTGTLLALSDLDSGRVEAVREVVDTVALGESLQSRHSAAAGEAGIHLDIADLGKAGRPLGDPLRVLQIASALIGNAITYTPTGGRVCVSASVSGGRWCLAVDDSGPGVPVEDRDRIFERFVRLDDSRSASTGGSGLGLAICKRLVTLMNGVIAVGDSDLGGARFAVCLDAASGMDNADEP